MAVTSKVTAREGRSEFHVTDFERDPSATAGGPDEFILRIMFVGDNPGAENIGLSQMRIGHRGDSIREAKNSGALYWLEYSMNVPLPKNISTNWVDAILDAIQERQI